MGRKEDASGLRARIRSAGVQFKVLEQKGVIDIWSIQVWFGMLFGSFSLLYCFWNLFVVENDPMAHFPPHMRAEIHEQKELFRQFGKRQGIANQIHIGFVACDVSKSDEVIASVKNFVLLSISPVNIILFTQDSVMKKIIGDIERFSWSVPGRLTFQFEFAKENLFTEGESYPCAQQKLMIPADLQKRAIPAFIISSDSYLTTSNLDDLWQREIIQMEDGQAMGTFLDSDQPSSDLLTFDLIHVAEAMVTANCGTDKELQGSWHQWQIWKALQEQNSNQLGSIQAELEAFRTCNPALYKSISFEFENGKLGLRRAFNQKVFDAIQVTFRHISAQLEGTNFNFTKYHLFKIYRLGFNELAWQALENTDPNNTDRQLLTELLEKINAAAHTGLLNDKKSYSFVWI